MSADATLLDVFLGEAIAAVAVLQDDGASDDRKRRALTGAIQAAELVGDPDLSARVAAIELGAGAADRLAHLIRGLRSTGRVPPGATDRGHAVGSASSKFDTHEHETLLSFFRDEAFDALDRVTATLSQLSAPPDAAALEELMRTTHGLKGAAGTVDLPVVADLTHRLEGCFQGIRDDSIAWSRGLQDALIEIADSLRTLIAHAPGAPERKELEDRLRRQLIGVASWHPSETKTGEYVRADSESDTLDRRVVDRRTRSTQTVLRVDPGRIDRLMDSVGELVFDRTRIERRVAELSSALLQLGWLETEIRATGFADEAQKNRMLELARELRDQLDSAGAAAQALSEDARALRRTERALQDGLTAVRMQLVRSLFQVLAPHLRAISRQAGKRVRLVTSGGETEFDKAVADQIVDPVVQLLRNAVAHGIESSAERLAAGKPEEARIHMSARHEGNTVVIEVSDDGRGIDTEAVRQKLVESGYWTRSRAQTASDADVHRALLEAGVSSRPEADELAGRGVGLSSVHETVTRLGGEVLVSSTAGSGTTFTFRLPLTTAVTNALLFKVGGHVFAVPNVHVLETLSLELSSPALPDRVSLRGSAVPLLPLHRVLGFEFPKDARNTNAFVIEYSGQRLAMTCDKIVGPREIVLKNLGPFVAPLPIYAGGTISGSGKVQLILDPAALVELVAADTGDTPSAKPREATPERPTPDIGRTLVVDDSRAIRETMAQLLSRSGVESETAADGGEALALLTSGTFRLLITDLEMPGIGGFELIERVRADRVLRRLPIIIISSRVDASTRDRARALGVDNVLAKPITGPALIAALSRLASRSRPAT